MKNQQLCHSEKISILGTLISWVHEILSMNRLQSGQDENT